MRILLTGMTKMQANRPRRREYNTSINALYHALRAAKHEVIWRALQYNEKRLDKEFDLIILGLGTISEFSCTYLYEALLATQYDNVLYLVNDWKANGTIKTLVDGDLFRDFVLKNNTGNRLNQERVMRDERLLEACRNQMFRIKNNILGPFFSWGDRTIITEGTPFESIYEFNPTIFYLNHWKGKIEMPTTRKRQWVYGALSDYSKWHGRLGGTWPIRAFNKKTFIPEEDLVKEYCRSYGMLMPKYKASGSGWWRARYCHAVMCKNVIYTDQQELAETKLWSPIETIEKMKAPKLQEFARYQANVIKRETPSWDDVVDIVDGIVQEVVT